METTSANKKKNLFDYKIKKNQKKQKIHKKNQDFFTIREDYFLIIAEEIYIFPDFGYKNLSLFIKDISFNTGKTFKSVQRRREKLKKLSPLQTAVIKNYYTKFLSVMGKRKIHNLKNELITILTTDNNDIPEEEKILINWIIENFEKKKKELENIENETRKRGRPRNSKSIRLQEDFKTIDPEEIYSSEIIEDLKSFLNQKKNFLKQIKFSDFLGIPEKKKDDKNNDRSLLSMDSNTSIYTNIDSSNITGEDFDNLNEEKNSLSIVSNSKMNESSQKNNKKETQPNRKDIKNIFEVNECDEYKDSYSSDGEKNRENNSLAFFNDKKEIQSKHPLTENLDFFSENISQKNSKKKLNYEKINEKKNIINDENVVNDQKENYENIREEKSIKNNRKKKDALITSEYFQTSVKNSNFTKQKKKIFNDSEFITSQSKINNVIYLQKNSSEQKNNIFNDIFQKKLVYKEIRNKKKMNITKIQQFDEKNKINMYFFQKNNK